VFRLEELIARRDNIDKMILQLSPPVNPAAPTEESIEWYEGFTRQATRRRHTTVLKFDRLRYTGSSSGIPIRENSSGFLEIMTIEAERNV
jgi:hypothetical protein